MAAHDPKARLAASSLFFSIEISRLGDLLESFKEDFTLV